VCVGVRFFVVVCFAFFCCCLIFSLVVPIF
jgi:hypothetical protein